jgi:two-component system LytT family response regulator
MVGLMRALVVDDDPQARARLAALLAAHGGITVAGQCDSALEAIPAVRASRPDILFLDIHMPKVDGFELLDLIDPELRPCVVFVTSHGHHALQAFDRNAVDYLLKPVKAERLAQCITRVQRFLGGDEALPPGGPCPRIPCVGGQGIKLIDCHEVEFVRSNETGVHLVTARGEFLTALTLALLEARSPDLVRCHKQFLVNLSQVDEIGRFGAGAGQLRTRGGWQVPVSRRHLPGLKARLGI